MSPSSNQGARGAASASVPHVGPPGHLCPRGPPRRRRSARLCSSCCPWRCFSFWTTSHHARSCWKRLGGFHPFFASYSALDGVHVGFGMPSGLFLTALFRNFLLKSLDHDDFTVLSMEFGSVTLKQVLQ